MMKEAARAKDLPGTSRRTEISPFARSGRSSTEENPVQGGLTCKQEQHSEWASPPYLLRAVISVGQAENSRSQAAPLPTCADRSIAHSFHCSRRQSGQVLSIGSSDLELTEWYRGHSLKRSGMNGISNSDALILRRRLQPSSSQPLGLRVTIPAEPASAAQSTQEWVFHHTADDIGGCPGM
jgi:hypothetical protein